MLLPDFHPEPTASSRSLKSPGLLTHCQCGAYKLSFLLSSSFLGPENLTPNQPFSSHSLSPSKPTFWCPSFHPTRWHPSQWSSPPMARWVADHVCILFSFPLAVLHPRAPVVGHSEVISGAFKGDQSRDTRLRHDRMQNPFGRASGLVLKSESAGKNSPDQLGRVPCAYQEPRSHV